ncbi:hypothetical protein GCM10011344_29450 [Dokdonia pacifica]|uniref:Transglutaminase-like superfamily protein n=1 Tax=Dokdonia pacifica TaxID=1627892 RepID=A0A239C346_9FLAO|nr:DUF3857 domain-containing protein [Dokdonia pacifica]GGG26781.1 hypothetical protein GCM10011344_29450 [Dokdonia pacifica]SNS14596.1 Transglutaminase-like superfamily protein [Dokdonia pacifica]
MLKNFIIYLFLITGLTVHAQLYKFGEVKMDEISAEKDFKFPEADAVILYRSVEVQVGEYVIVKERYKILTENGYDYATVSIPYPNVQKVEGATYNIVDGKIEKTELNRKLVFEDEVVKGVKIRKFTFPKVSVGSVLEFKYKATRSTVSDIDMQYNIPIKRLNLIIRNNTETNYKILQNPRSFLLVSRKQSGKTTTITASDVAPLEEENYVYDMDLFRSKIQFKFTGFQDFLKLSSFEDIGKFLLELDDFQRTFKAIKSYDDDVEALLGGEKDQEKQAKLIYNYLKKEIKWNGRYGFISDNNSSRDTFKKKEGDNGDVNGLFISMLRSIGIEADPVLASTKANGIPMTPSVEAFNYVLATAVINGERKVFDLAQDDSSYRMIAEKLLNWQGYVLKDKDNLFWIDLTKTAFSSKDTMINVTIDEDLVVSGDAREKSTGHYSMDIQSYVEDLSEKNIKNIVPYETSNCMIDEVAIDSNDDVNNVTTVSFDFEMENVVDEIGDKLYVSPMFFMGLEENPFLKEERKYPIDFGFPKRKRGIIKIIVPEGYQVESIPQSLSIRLPDNLGSFSLNLSQNANFIQIASKYEINTSVFPFDRYLDLKAFFKARIEKEAEKIVFVKS